MVVDTSYYTLRLLKSDFMKKNKANIWECIIKFAQVIILNNALIILDHYQHDSQLQPKLSSRFSPNPKFDLDMTCKGYLNFLTRVLIKQVYWLQQISAKCTIFHLQQMDCETKLDQDDNFCYLYQAVNSAISILLTTDQSEKELILGRILCWRWNRQN